MHLFQYHYDHIILIFHSVEVDITKTSTNTNTSISLKWTNDSINCPRNTQLFHSCVSCRIETEVKGKLQFSETF